MRGLLVDYVGVLDGSDEDQRRWKSFFAAVREKGIPVAILSNDPGGPGADDIREWEFRGYVDAVLLSGEIGAEKPTREAFDLAADTLEVDRSQLVLVDDSIVNVKGAIEQGLMAIHYQQFDRAIVVISAVLDVDGEF